MARAAGADDTWAHADRKRSVEFIYREGKLETVKESTSRSLSIEIYVDGRYSRHKTTDLRPERLQEFVEQAVALTRALQPDPFRQIPDPALYEGRSDVDLDLVDRDMAAITQEQRAVWCAEMDTASYADESVISATNQVVDTHLLSADMSSNGFSGTRESTMLYYYTEVTVRDEGDKRPEGWHWAVSRHLDDLPAGRDVAAEALRRALARKGASQGPTGRLSMVVDREAGARLLRALLAPANARSIQQGRSFWANKTGQQLFGQEFDLYDEPLLPRGLGSRTFDGEGIAARRFPVVEGGVVRNLYVDTYYGRKLGVAPTTGSGSNQVLVPGQVSREEILRQVEQGVYVTGWLGGNSDPTSGDFSFGIRGYLIEDGRVGRPVGEMNVTGNLVELFNHLVLRGDDPWPYSSVPTPTLVFEGVEFAGA